jgi:hypothetical protein
MGDHKGRPYVCGWLDSAEGEPLCHIPAPRLVGVPAIARLRTARPRAS